MGGVCPAGSAPWPRLTAGLKPGGRSTLSQEEGAAEAESSRRQVRPRNHTSGRSPGAARTRPAQSAVSAPATGTEGRRSSFQRSHVTVCPVARRPGERAVYIHSHPQRAWSQCSPAG